jgi:hypothetical protein
LSIGKKSEDAVMMTQKGSIKLPILKMIIMVVIMVDVDEGKVIHTQFFTKQYPPKIY